MSFYGNVTYYLSNAFGNMVYRNANSASKKSNGDSVPDGTASPSRTVAYEYTLSPRSRNDDMILETGNKWIVFGAGSQALQNNQISIYHQTRSSGQGGSLAISVAAPQEGQDQEGTVLDFKSIITIPTIAFDEAGHIADVDSVKYIMPNPPGEQDLQAVKDRVKALELKINGMSEGEMGNLDEALANRITDLSTKVNNWDLKQLNDTQNMYKEQYGIGTTLHELMVLIGIREKTTYESQTTGLTTDGYSEVSVENAGHNARCLIGMATQSVTNSQTAAITAIQNRNGIRELINLLQTKISTFTEQEATDLKNTYFNLAT